MVSQYLLLLNGNRTLNWLLTGTSAILFSLSFLFPELFFWTIFLFFIPLWQLFITGGASFCKGFVWGLICWSLQLSALLLFLIEHGTSSLLLRLCAWLLLVVYLSIYAGIWFFINNMCFLYFLNEARNGLKAVVSSEILQSNTQPSHKATAGSPAIHPGNKFPGILASENKCTKIILLLISFFYFYWIDRGVFFIFGRWFGYPFSNPLLPLTVLGSVVGSQPEKLSFMHSIVITKPKNVTSAWQRAYDFLEQCKQSISINPAVNVIITPETAFPFPLNLYPEFIALWSEYPGLAKIHFLIGAHRQEGEKLFNTLYHIHQGRIIEYYDKKTTLLIAEELPKSSIWAWTKQLFLENKQSICTSVNEKKPIIIAELPKLLPYICSDLFFCNEEPSDEQAMILCIANDNWFSLQYFKKLMRLHIILKECVWKKRILYVS